MCLFVENLFVNVVYRLHVAAVGLIQDLEQGCQESEHMREPAHVDMPEVITQDPACTWSYVSQ